MEKTFQEIRYQESIHIEVELYDDTEKTTTKACVWFHHGHVFLFQNEHDGSSSSLISDKRGYTYSKRIDNRVSYYEGNVVPFDIFKYDEATHTPCGIWKSNITNVTIISIEQPGMIMDENYTKTQIYHGRHGYHDSHYNHIMNTPLEIPDGNVLMGVEIETKAKNDIGCNILEKIRSNIMFTETDGSLGGYGYEWISIPLRPEDAMSVEFWKKITDAIEPYAMVDSSCGLHIHISKSLFGNTAPHIKRFEGKLEAFYQYCIKGTSMNIAINGRRHGYDEYNPTSNTAQRVLVGNNNITFTNSLVEQIIDEMLDSASTTRYCNVNVLNSKTVEFRLGAGTLDPKVIAARCEYYFLMMKFVMTIPWAEMNINKFKNYLMENIDEEDFLRTFLV